MWTVSLRYLKTLWRCLNRDDAAGLAAEMTYNWMLSLLPALIFIFTLFGMFGVKSAIFEELMARVYLLAPQDAYQVLQTNLMELTRASNGGLALLSLFGAVGTASNGVNSVQKALDRAFRGVERRRGMVRHAIVSFLVILGMGILMFVSANLIVFGDLIFKLIRQAFDPDNVFLFLLGWLRWGIAITGLVLTITFIYWLAPDVRAAHLPFRRRVLPGTLVFVPLWILISWLFSLYVTNFGHYNKIYGSMGAIIVLMIWLYLTSYTLIIGGEVNAMASGCSEDALNSLG